MTPIIRENTLCYEYKVCKVKIHQTNIRKLIELAYT